MGNGYSVTCKMKVKYGKTSELINAVKDYINANPLNANFSLEDYAKDGIGTDTIDDLCRVFFAGWEGQRVHISTDEHGYKVYANSFDASYGWEPVMYDFFRVMSDYLEDGSRLLVYMDEGSTEMEIEDGELIEW